MTGQCSLAADINNCQYYVPECAGCNAPHDKCGMQLFGSLKINVVFVYCIV